MKRDSAVIVEKRFSDISRSIDSIVRIRSAVATMPSGDKSSLMTHSEGLSYAVTTIATSLTTFANILPTKQSPTNEAGEVVAEILRLFTGFINHDPPELSDEFEKLASELATLRVIVTRLEIEFAQIRHQPDFISGLDLGSEQE